MRWPVSPPAGRPPVNGVISNGSAPNNGRLNSYSSNSNSDQIQDLSYSSESSCQQFALHEKWRQLFDKFDSEGFGEIPWEDFLIALNSPEFVAHIDPTKRDLLAAKAKESRSTSITFQDFVNVLSGKRSLSFKLAVQQRDRELWSHPPCHRQHQFPCRSYDRNDRRSYRPDEDVYHEEDEDDYYDYTSCCSATPSAGRYGVTSGGSSGGGGGGPAVTFETSSHHPHQDKDPDDEDATGGQCLLTPGHRSGQGYPAVQGSIQSPSSVSGGSSRSRVPGTSSQHQRISANGRKGRVVAAAKRRPIFGKMVRAVAKEFLADERDRKYYADNYTCCPPPLFVILVTLVELGFFTYYTLSMGQITTTGPVPIDSLFIYRPDKRSEVWRFVFYMVLHAGWIHLLFNLLVQVLVGLPLEMVHGSLRIGTVYMAGVLAGSLGTSIFDTEVYLVGASGGVYALLAAHLANVLLNYHQMEFGLIRLGGVFIIASADVGFAIYDRYAAAQHGPPVSYVAHLTGALAGLTIGLLVLKNFEQKLHEQLLWWVALGVYAACTLFALLFNVFNY